MKRESCSTIVRLEMGGCCEVMGIFDGNSNEGSDGEVMVARGKFDLPQTGGNRACGM